MNKISAIEYYQRPFFYFLEQLERIGYTSSHHPVRQRYWQLFIPRLYTPIEAKPLLLKYAQIVEQEFQQTISKHSLTYWLHLYRRLFPRSIGRDKTPATIMLVRANMEAAIQKFAKQKICESIALSHNVGVEKIFNGLLLHEDFKLERQIVAETNQLVLTTFDIQAMIEFFDVEKLAYEQWRTSAMLRIIGKGAPLTIGISDDYVADSRSAELDYLVTNYDSRNRGISATSALSSRGIVSDLRNRKSIPFWLPTYNVYQVDGSLFNDTFGKLFEIIIPEDFILNFLWYPFDLKSFRELHLPYSSAFSEKYKVSFDAVIVIVGALLMRVFYTWKIDRVYSLNRFWQRAYEGPEKEVTTRGLIQEFIPDTLKALSIDQSNLDPEQFDKAFKFWSLTSHVKTAIDTVYAGPHSIFIPCDRDHIFIDYTWISRRLYDLFVDLQISDENFKAKFLENLLNKEPVLPTKECKAMDGSRKQVDGSFAIGNRLIIIECKASNKSIAFERGDPDAIQRRTNKIQKELKEVDDKARWLQSHKKGTNFDASRFTEILPILITPFVEFIPSKDPFYWIKEGLPRVLTPAEFEGALTNGSLGDSSLNVFQM